MNHCIWLNLIGFRSKAAQSQEILRKILLYYFRINLFYNWPKLNDINIKKKFNAANANKLEGSASDTDKLLTTFAANELPKNFNAKQIQNSGVIGTDIT